MPTPAAPSLRRRDRWSPVHSRRRHQFPGSSSITLIPHVRCETGRNTDHQNSSFPLVSIRLRWEWEGGRRRNCHFFAGRGRITRAIEKCAAAEGSGGLEDQKGILGGVLQIGVKPGRSFRIYEACDDRAGSLGRSGGRGGKPAQTHEAGVDQSVVVVEFENVEKAIAAYESDRYRPALKVFDDATQRDFRIVEGR
jgi:hypothetical protein